MTQFFKAISILFHPLLLATYSCGLIYFIVPELYLPIPEESVPYFIGAVFLTTCIIPFISLGFLFLSKKISELEITQRQERVLPFFSIAAFYAMTTYMFYIKVPIPWIILLLMIVVSMLVLILAFINIRFKISIHSAGIWGVAGIFSALMILAPFQYGNYILAGIFLASGLTTTSRLYLGYHSSVESWCGVAFGFCFCFASVYWLA